MKMLVGAVALCLAAGTAAADIQMESDSFSFPLSPGAQNLSIPQFDTMGGLRELCKVTLELDATIGANVEGENRSAISGQLSANFSGFATASVGGLFAFANFNFSDGPIPVAASDGIPDSGPDYHDFGFLSDTESAMDMAVSGFAPFIGGGFLSVPVQGGGGFSLAGVSDSNLRVTNFAASGSVKITYEYKLVPAPASAALLGLAGLVAGRRRR